MSKAQYNLNTPTDYLSRRMFLDPAGPVTIQRFEEVKYNKLVKFEQEARGFFWVPEEINLTKDSADFKDASETVRHIFTSNLLRQTALDSLQGRGPAQVFTPVVSIPELEALMYNWSFFETNIHSRSYSHIIRNIYNVPKEVFNTIHDTKEIVDMASSVGQYYDKLHVANSNIESGLLVEEEDHIRAIWLALNAKQACEAEVYAMYLAVIGEEKAWADYLFKKGPVIGLNANILREFVDFTAFNALREIGVRYDHPHPKSTPIPWFMKHVNTSSKQTALQESESTNYVIGIADGIINYDELPAL
jgi:ribonucleoside-diphosphate reductase beta chain